MPCFSESRKNYSCANVCSNLVIWRHFTFIGVRWMFCLVLWKDQIYLYSLNNCTFILTLQYKLTSLQPVVKCFELQYLFLTSQSRLVTMILWTYGWKNKDDEKLQQRNVLHCNLLVHVVVFEEKPSELCVCNELTEKFNKVQTILTVLCFIVIRHILSFSPSRYIFQAKLIELYVCKCTVLTYIIHNVHPIIIFDNHTLSSSRKVWIYQRGNQNL